MNRQEHLLQVLSEECAEVSQRASKALRFGASEIQPGQDLTNAERLAEELCHIFAAIEMLEDEGVIMHLNLRRDVIAEKKRKVEHFLEYSRKCGTLS